MSKDVLQKTVILLLVLVLVGAGGYLWQRQAQKPPVEAPLPQKRERVVRTITLKDTADPARRFATDNAAMEAVRNCEAAGINITACVAQLRQRYDVQAGLPAAVADDGFEGFIMFPLSGGGNLILDYNAADHREQSVFYGDFSDLQDLVEQGGLGDRLLGRINSIQRQLP